MSREDRFVANPVHSEEDRNRFSIQKDWIHSVLAHYFEAVEELGSLPLRDPKLREMLRADFYDREIAADIELCLIQLARAIRKQCRTSLGQLRMKLAEMASNIDEDLNNPDFLPLDQEISTGQVTAAKKQGLMMLENGSNIKNKQNTDRRNQLNQDQLRKSYPSKPVKPTELKPGAEKVEKSEKAEKVEKIERVERVENIEKSEKVEKVEKVEKPPLKSHPLSKPNAPGPSFSTLEHSALQNQIIQTHLQRPDTSINENHAKKLKDDVKNDQKTNVENLPKVGDSAGKTGSPLEVVAKLRNEKEIQPVIEKEVQKREVIVERAQVGIIKQEALPISELMEQTTGHCDKRKIEIPLEMPKESVNDLLDTQNQHQRHKFTKTSKKYTSTSITIIKMDDILGKRKPEVCKQEKIKPIPACLRAKNSASLIASKSTLENTLNRGFNNLQDSDDENLLEDQITIQLEEEEEAPPLRIKLPPPDVAEESPVFKKFEEVERERKRQLESTGLRKLRRNRDLYPTDSPDTQRRCLTQVPFSSIFDAERVAKSPARFRGAELSEAKNHYLPSLGSIFVMKARFYRWQ